MIRLTKFDDGLLCEAVYFNKASKYLRKQVGEGYDDFSKRVNSSVIDTTFARGIDNTVKLTFKQEIVTNSDVLNFNKCGKDVLTDLLIHGIVFVHVWNTLDEELDKAHYTILDLKIIEEVILNDLNEIHSIQIKGEEFDIIYFSDGTIQHVIGDKVIHEEMAIIFPFVMIRVPKVPYLQEAKFQISHYNIDSAREAYGLKLLNPIVKSWGMLQNQDNIATDLNGVTKVEFQATRGIDFPMFEGKKGGDIEILELNGTNDSIASNFLEYRTKQIENGFLNSILTPSATRKTEMEILTVSAPVTSTLTHYSKLIVDALINIGLIANKIMSINSTIELSHLPTMIHKGLTQEEYLVLKELKDDGLLSTETYMRVLKSKFDMLKDVDLSKEPLGL